MLLINRADFRILYQHSSIIIGDNAHANIKARFIQWIY